MILTQKTKNIVIYFHSKSLRHDPWSYEARAGVFTRSHLPTYKHLKWQPLQVRILPNKHLSINQQKGPTQIKRHTQPQTLSLVIASFHSTARLSSLLCNSGRRYCKSHNTQKRRESGLALGECAVQWTVINRVGLHRRAGALGGAHR
jgi:hypothetical protein